MSDTTGWKYDKRRRMYKQIGDNFYELRETDPGLWCMAVFKSELVEVAPLADAKRAAHRHAEENR